MALLEPGDVTALLEAGVFSEGPQLEAKQGLSGFPRNGWETVSAFANTDGGVIVLGLAEDGDDWRVEGVADAEDSILRFQLAMRNRQQISSEVADSSDIWTEEVSGRTLVIIRIRRAALRQMPVHLNGDSHNTFLRRGEFDARCTSDELNRMYREATQSSYDTGVISFLGEEDFDQKTVERYRQMSQRTKPNLPHHSRDGRAYLEAIGAWRTDRERGVAGPTRAGILVLGTREAIGAIRDNHRIDYRRVSSLDPAANRYDERIEWDGNLFGAWENIFPSLTRGLPVPFRLEGAHRIDRPAGLETLREAFVNLLIHTDYQEIDDAVITHRDDGYRFRNPGQSRVAIDHLGVDDSSIRRNQKIAELFSHIGLAERAGSGFIWIFDEWPKLGYRRPQVTSDPTTSSFILELSLAAFIPSADRVWLESFGESWREDEELALWLTRRYGRLDNQTLRERTGQHMSDASRTLVSLKNREYLSSKGSGRNIYYVLGTKSLLEERQYHTDPDGLGREGDGLGREGDGLGHEGDGLGREGDGLSLYLTYQHPQSLILIASSLRSARKSPTSEEVLETILRLCTVEPLSIKQLAEITKRKVPTLRPYLRELQSQGKLRKADREPGNREERYVTSSTSTARQQEIPLLDLEEDLS